jgi:hypothetical protein
VVLKRENMRLTARPLIQSWSLSQVIHFTDERVLAVIGAARNQVTSRPKAISIMVLRDPNRAVNSMQHTELNQRWT